MLNDGIRFTNCHSNCPVCSPSRAALLTGRFPDMVGVPGVIRTHAENSWGYLSPDAILLPQILKNAGYHTAIIGKWHLGLTSPNLPNERGFDFFHGFLGDMMDDYFTHLRHGNNYMRKNREIIDPKGHATDIFTGWAIDYVDQRRVDKNPFFLYLAYNEPHTPLQPTEESLEKVRKRNPGISDKRSRLLALIEHMDSCVGQLMAALQKNGQLENTLIIFASDNGGQASSESNNLPFRGAKENMYEGGIRVPGGIYWKGKINPVVNDNFVVLSDLFPTLCELTGVPFTHQVDGISILPVIKGQKQVTDDRMVFWVRREGDMRFGGQDYHAVRYKNYKLLRNTPWEPYKLFDVVNDYQEKTPIDDKDNEMYKKLFLGLKEHIRKARAIPWQNVNE